MTEKKSKDYTVLYKGIAYMLVTIGFIIINAVFLKLKGFEFTLILILSQIKALILLLYFRDK